MRNYPEIENEMRAESTKYNDHWKNFQINILSNIDYFQALPYPLREEIHYRLALENHEPGAKIFSRGADC